MELTVCIKCRNWLRDYSQIADTSAFKFLNLDELLSILSIVGFLNFGYSGSEYEITSDRLGVYLPVSSTSLRVCDRPSKFTP